MAEIIVSVTTVTDKVSPEIARIIAGMENTRPLMAAVGGEMAKTIRGHFRAQGGANSRFILAARAFVERVTTSREVVETGVGLVEPTVSPAEVADKGGTVQGGPDMNQNGGPPDPANQGGTPGERDTKEEHGRRLEPEVGQLRPAGDEQ
jgi:hypothetical protein